MVQHAVIAKLERSKLADQVKLKIEMKIKRAVTPTGTLYETTTLVKAFYSSGMAESILSGVTIGKARLFATQTHGKRSRSRTNAECRELSTQWKIVELIFCIVRPRDLDINSP